MDKPKVVIIGKPNVGKSTLFNKIAKKRISIVDNISGITRDRIYADAEWLNYKFTIIDTGGIELRPKNFMVKLIREQANIAIKEADTIIFVVDSKTGVTSLDLEISTILRDAQKPVIVAVNKTDSIKDENNIYEFYNLGLSEPIGISASNGLNIGDLLERVIKNISIKDIHEDHLDKIKVAVIGRPNVGKSSLINSILGVERVIVSENPGTTRDAVDTYFTKDNTMFILIDTAGMRRKGKIDLSIERYSVIRALQAIDCSDVVLMVLDATEGVMEQDKKIVGYAHEAGKAIVLVMNKWDLINKNTKSIHQYTENIRLELAFLTYAPILFISAITGQRINRISELVKFVSNQHSMRISTSILNQVISDAISINPPPSFKGKQLKIYYTTQPLVKPPTFIFFVNNIKFMHFSYLRFLENKLREAFGFEGTPLKLLVRGHNKEE